MFQHSLTPKKCWFSKLSTTHDQFCGPLVPHFRATPKDLQGCGTFVLISEASTIIRRARRRVSSWLLFSSGSFVIIICVCPEGSQKIFKVSSLLCWNSSEGQPAATAMTFNDITQRYPEHVSKQWPPWKCIQEPVLKWPQTERTVITWTPHLKANMALRSWLHPG